MNTENLGLSSTKDKPIIATGPAHRPQLAQLPEWPARTIAVLSTIDGGPHAISAVAPLRAGDQRILASLERTRVRWLAYARTHMWRSRSSPGAIALSQHSVAPASSKNLCQMRRIMLRSKSMEIDDHRSPGVVVESGVRVQFANDA